MALLTVAFFLEGTGLTRLENIRYYTYPDYTRVVLDLSSPLKVTEKILPGEGKDRLYFDMEKCDFANQYPAENRKEILVGTGHLQRIRLAKKDNTRLRVVLDFDRVEKYSKFYLSSPFRVVFDVFKVAPDASGHAEKTDGAPETISKPAQPVDKNYSMVRQLGLGVRTIVIDPGHGGKDPGTSNSSLKVDEKDITLDIAKRLKELFQKNAEYDIILTREHDRYISLEERTAIANSKKGDLFVSIHLNSAPRKSARGIESYFLSMTTDPWAMQVAAVENKINAKSIGDIDTIVERIVKHTQISESKVFAGFLQKNLVTQLRGKYKSIDDLGVKKAPFFVLVGAGMPAALVEVSFLSNYKECKRLKSQAYRYTIALGLYSGIISYIKSLGKK